MYRKRQLRVRSSTCGSAPNGGGGVHMWPLVRAHREIEQGRTPANGRARTRAAHGHPPGRRTCAAPGGVQRTPPARGEVPAARPPAPFPCRDTDPKTAIAIGSNTAQYWCSCSRTKFESRKDIFLPACKYRAIIRPACTYRGDFLLASKFLPALPPFHSCDCPFIMMSPPAAANHTVAPCRPGTASHPFICTKASPPRLGPIWQPMPTHFVRTRCSQTLCKADDGENRTVATSQRAIQRGQKPPRGMREPTASTPPSKAPHTSQPHSVPYHGGTSHPAAGVCAQRARTPPRPRTRRNHTARLTPGEKTTPRHACVHSEHAPLQGLAHAAVPAEIHVARLHLNE